MSSGSKEELALISAVKNIVLENKHSYMDIDQLSMAFFGLQNLESGFILRFRSKHVTSSMIVFDKI
jgi:hypothetical protein